MHVIYIPLDDRPCNVNYPQWIARLQPQIQLRIPPPELLGKKKKAAPLDRLWNWLADTLASTPNAVGSNTIGILSMEMLLYGGLLPSRLHYCSLETLMGRVQKIRELKSQYPQFKIFASSLIMRCPTYNSAEEEPDYYEQWGATLFRWGWLCDQSQQFQGSQQFDESQQSNLLESEQQEWLQIQQQLPAEILQDYCDRRRINLEINLAIVDLVAEGTIHFLSIPQDDAAPTGFTRIDQRVISTQIQRQNLAHCIHLYPGADEVGCTLLARAFLEQEPQNAPRIYPLYGTSIEETLIPLYEDRPLGDSVQAHLRATGAQIAMDPQDADLILALNTPGLVMQESWEQETKNESYFTQRNLGDFIDRIGQYLTQGKRVALADVAFANGGETECIERLDQAQILDRLVAYGGWNTCGNTLGTVISTAILGWRSTHPQAIVFNLMSRLWEDWLYQSIVRQNVIAHYLPTIGASYYQFAQQDQAIAEETQRCLQQEWILHCSHSFQHYAIQSVTVQHPWQRMFEIALNLELDWLG